MGQLDNCGGDPERYPVDRGAPRYPLMQTVVGRAYD